MQGIFYCDLYGAFLQLQLSLIFVYFSIPSSTFENISKEIVNLFTKENKYTYYVAYRAKSRTSPKLAPKDKLYCAYVNFRNLLKSSKKNEELTATAETESMQSFDFCCFIL